MCRDVWKHHGKPLNHEEQARPSKKFFCVNHLTQGKRILLYTTTDSSLNARVTGGQLTVA
jgi:hypothetical protein